MECECFYAPEWMYLFCQEDLIKLSTSKVSKHENNAGLVYWCISTYVLPSVLRSEKHVIFVQRIF